MGDPRHRRSYRRLAARLRAQGGPCAHCGAYVPPGQGEADHLLPVAVAGGFGPILLSCRRCNRSRGAVLGLVRRAGRRDPRAWSSRAW